MFKRAFVFVAVCGCVGLAAAQGLLVASSSHVVLDNGNPASAIHLTKFNEVLVGSEVRHQFIVRNPAPSGNLVITSFTVIPPFSLDLAQTVFTVPPNGNTTFDVVFAPPAAIEYNGTITIASNAGPNFMFSLSGTGINSPPLSPHPDLYITMLKPAKTKYIKSTGQLRVTAKLQILNLGDADAPNPVVLAVHASTEYLAFPVPVLAEARAKPLAAMNNGKVSKAKVRVRVDGLANADGCVFFNAWNSPDNVDLDFADNVGYVQYGAHY